LKGAIVVQEFAKEWSKIDPKEEQQAKQTHNTVEGKDG